jgi:septal ring factor EnvC (AmiA/AmiB activator)
MTQFSDIIIPVVVAVVLSVSASLVTARMAGPAQQAYIAALEARMRVVSADRDDALSQIAKLEARIVQLEAQVEMLQREATVKDHEVAKLYRRLDADEKRMIHDERRLPPNDAP